ncbi:hypothetical protein FYM84_27125 [Pseudomonas sp. CAH-1]|nr:hypothetical protein [Pseudomonas sp. CAH-1]
MSWRSESPFTVGFRAYVGFWFHCSPNPFLTSKTKPLLQHTLTPNRAPGARRHPGQHGNDITCRRGVVPTRPSLTPTPTPAREPHTQG